MSSRFWITVLGPDAKALGRAYLACESAREASILAFNTASPFGHQLWSSDGLMGVFDTALSANEPTTPVE
ncbi:hypothetical protein [Phenylobacterium sp.]|jgi:hypothetical protein|uniref:hypothetical protein n=1 Tax=Phenylobacterium sp. TaxID=1871053 RepID=UPI0035B4EC46